MIADEFSNPGKAVGLLCVRVFDCLVTVSCNKFLLDPASNKEFETNHSQLW